MYPTADNCRRRSFRPVPRAPRERRTASHYGPLARGKRIPRPVDSMGKASPGIVPPAPPHPRLSQGKEKGRRPDPFFHEEPSRAPKERRAPQFHHIGKESDEREGGLDRDGYSPGLARTGERTSSVEPNTVAGTHSYREIACPGRPGGGRSAHRRLFLLLRCAAGKRRASPTALGEGLAASGPAPARGHHFRHL